MVVEAVVDPLCQEALLYCLYPVLVGEAEVAIIQVVLNQEVLVVLEVVVLVEPEDLQKMPMVEAEVRKQPVELEVLVV
jgi:hypothetical protein